MEYISAETFVVTPDFGAYFNGSPAGYQPRLQAIEVFFGRDKGRSVAGVRKIWHLLKRDGVQVASCTVERLMSRLGLTGIHRDGKRVITTIALSNWQTGSQIS